MLIKTETKCNVSVSFTLHFLFGTNLHFKCNTYLDKFKIRSNDQGLYKPSSVLFIVDSSQMLS